LVSLENKYPVESTIYMQTTGKLLPRRIYQILRELGLRVWINPKQGNDIDLKVWYDNSLLIAGEILNWSVKSLLSHKRQYKIVSNLEEYDCRRLVVYTTLDERSISIFAEEGIDVLRIGYQILPRHYYNFFLQKNQVENRRIDSAETKQEIRELLLNYLEKHFQHVRI